MKKLLKITTMFLCAFMDSYGIDDNQPALTDEMLLLGLTPFTERNEQIRTIYLVNDAIWEETIKKAAEQFAVIEDKRKKEGENEKLIPLYWTLSQTYDYGPANAILCSSFCLGEFGLTKNSDWGRFFDTGRPEDVYDMNFKRKAYFIDRDYYLGERSNHEQSSDSSTGVTSHNGSFSCEEKNPQNSIAERQSLLRYGSAKNQTQKGLRRRYVKN